VHTAPERKAALVGARAKQAPQTTGFLETNQAQVSTKGVAFVLYDNTTNIPHW
jgi:hypothetical protein